MIRLGENSRILTNLITDVNVYSCVSFLEQTTSIDRVNGSLMFTLQLYYFTYLHFVFGL